MRTAGIVLQARMGSSRLPGKALALIARRTILEHCLARLHMSGVGPVLLATTTRRQDDVLVEIAQKTGALVMRGDSEDVLARFVKAADILGAETIIRATADNPGVDIDAPRRLLAATLATGSDYACEEGLPVGAGVEVIAYEALVRAAQEATDPYDREHVTTYVHRHPARFHVVRMPAPPSLRRPDLRLTVDTAEDLAFVRGVFFRTGVGMPSLLQLIAAAGPSTRQEVA